MPIPFRMSPAGSVEDIPAPFREHLVAVYKDGKAFVMPGKQLSDSYNGFNTQCMVVNGPGATQTRFYDGVGICGLFVDGSGISLYSITNKRSRVSYIATASGKLSKNDICFGCVQYNFIDGILYRDYGSGTGDAYDWTKDHLFQRFTNVSFACCFDTKLTKEETQEFAKWIRRSVLKIS